VTSRATFSSSTRSPFVVANHTPAPRRGYGRTVPSGTPSVAPTDVRDRDAPVGQLQELFVDVAGPCSCAS
jgi:hypothetical protein